jgi:hypothetical protein
LTALETSRVIVPALASAKLVFPFVFAAVLV